MTSARGRRSRTPIDRGAVERRPTGVSVVDQRHPAPRHVLDATALLCLLFAEEGSDQIEALLPGGLVSAVNCQEVVAKLTDRGISMAEARAMIEAVDVEIVALDRRQAEAAEALRAGSRDRVTSRGERSCLALAGARSATAVTTDQAWASDNHGVAIKVPGQTTSRSKRKQDPGSTLF